MGAIPKRAKTIRIPTDLAEDVEFIARSEHRSFNRQVEHWLRQCVNDFKVSQKEVIFDNPPMD
ncbi:MAG: hypothetical protein HGJ93_00620 [Desulfosarcina sp.]|nr:hypothetical protein [Desulfosarcina sp.]MBC2764489.1 hypothetical protein [Desulfosarcina sp.]